MIASVAWVASVGMQRPSLARAMRMDVYMYVHVNTEVKR